MKYRSKRYRLALVLQIMLVHIHGTYSIHLIPRNLFQYNERNQPVYRPEEPIERELPNTIQEDESSLFLRNTKSDNQARMFSIDLSRLRQDASLAHNRHKPPVNLVGIDISVLSRNPDPTLPLAVKLPKDKMNGKYIMGYDFDSRFDRLPVIKTKPIRTYSPIPQAPIPQEEEKEKTVLPMMFVPLKVMTTYHSILEDRKHDIDFSEESSNSEENELKYTADFILHLLYQLSSNHKKETGN